MYEESSHCYLQKGVSNLVRSYCCLVILVRQLPHLPHCNFDLFSTVKPLMASIAFPHILNEYFGKAGLKTWNSVSFSGILPSISTTIQPAITVFSFLPQST